MATQTTGAQLAVVSDLRLAGCVSLRRTCLPGRWIPLDSLGFPGARPRVPGPAAYRKGQEVDYVVVAVHQVKMGW